MAKPPFKKYIIPIFLIGFFITLPASANVVINEIQIGGESSTDEFVELYNNGSEEVNLNGWRLSKRTASGTESNLLTTFPETNIAGNSTLVIAHTNFSGAADLTYSTQNSIASNNTVVLYSDSGDTIIDLVGMGDATSFENTSAPVPENNMSISRSNGKDTNNNATDFKIGSPTPGAASSTPQSNETGTTPTGTSSPQVNYAAGSIVINEFVSDPTPDEEEWIELLNTTSNEIFLDGWTIEDGSGKRINLSNRIVGNDYLVIEKPTFALNNTGDIIILRSPDEKIIDEVAYGNWDDGNAENNAPATEDPNSIARNENGEYFVTDTPTKGQTNVFSLIPEENNSQDTASKTEIIISELLPNPLGSDWGEFIELYNVSNQSIDLTNWKLKDSDGQTFTFSENIFLAGNNYLVLYRETTGIVLNNVGGDFVKLYKPDSDRAISSATYKGSAANQQSWALVNDVWLWTPSVTPGSENIYIPPNQPPSITIYAPAKADVGETIFLSAEDTFDLEGDPFELNWNLGNGNFAVGELVNYSYPKAGIYTINVSAWQNKNKASEENFTINIGNTAKPKVAGVSQNDNVVTNLSNEDFIKGIVTAGINDIEPNIIYIGALSGNTGGLRIDIPEGVGFDINRGDLIEVSGKIKNVAGEPRLQVTAVENIKFLKNENEIEPVEYDEDNAAELLGELVKITGTVGKGTSAGFYLEHDAGTMRIVVPKTIAPKRPFPTGTEATVTGILSKTSAGYRILTRDENDVLGYAPEITISSPPVSTPVPWYKNSTIIFSSGIAFIVLAAFYQLQKQQQKRLEPELIEEEIDF